MASGNETADVSNTGLLHSPHSDDTFFKVKCISLISVVTKFTEKFPRFNNFINFRVTFEIDSMNFSGTTIKKAKKKNRGKGFTKGRLELW